MPELKRRIVRWLAVAAVCAAAVAGCTEIRNFFDSEAPEIAGGWQGVLDEVRTFEKKIGFSGTENFKTLSPDHEPFSFCGQASRLVLPYSYEDPAIQWHDEKSEEECRAAGAGMDVYYGAVEALGEIGMPVTPSIIESRLDRFIYLIIHEDCHDQFQLPYGIEEALCEVITYNGMAAFSRQKYRWYTTESRSIQRYAADESRNARATIRHYEALESVYGRYQRKEITADQLLRDRAEIFRRADAETGKKGADLNNVIIAYEMTYSRHYPFLESMHEALGRDLGRTVAFFKAVDKAKPTPEAVMKRHKIASQESVEFVRAYEHEVIEATRKALAELKNVGSR